MTQTKTVYILLTRSGTWFSRLIHLATDDCYTHASIGLDGPAGPFYSFGRLDPRFALPAGLVQERLDGSPMGGRETPWCLCELEVSSQAYNHLKQHLSSMYARREQYHYNLQSAGCTELLLPSASAPGAPLFLFSVCGQSAGGKRRGGAGQMSRSGPPGGFLLSAGPALRAPGRVCPFPSLIFSSVCLFLSPPDLTEPIPTL